MLAAAATLQSQGALLYALVNNAGIGLNTPGDLMATNFLGPKRVSEAIVPLIEPGGRIANVSSGSASMWLRDQSEEVILRILLSSRLLVGGTWKKTRCPI